MRPVWIFALLLLCACEPARVTPFGLAEDAGIFSLTLVFENFDVPDGTAVTVEVESERQERFVFGGQFTTEDLRPTARELDVRVLFDLDANGTCDPDEAQTLVLEVAAGISVIRVQPADLGPATCP